MRFKTSILLSLIHHIVFRDSLGICIHTSHGSIVYTGEFKFDQSLQGHYAPDMKRMAEIGEEGVLL